MQNTETAEHAARDKAQWLSTHDPAIRGLYRSLRMESYFDGRYLAFGLQPPEDYDSSRRIPADVEKKKDEIDEILWNITCNEMRPRDTKGFKEAAAQLAQSYL